MCLYADIFKSIPKLLLFLHFNTKPRLYYMLGLLLNGDVPVIKTMDSLLVTVIKVLNVYGLCRPVLR